MKEETIESASEKILAALRSKPSPEVIKIIQKEFPPFAERSKRLSDRAIELSREIEQLLIKVNALRARINKDAQLSFSVVLGSSLLLWVFLSDRFKLIFPLLLAGIPVAALVILMRWIRRRRAILYLEVRAKQLSEDLRSDRNELENAYHILNKMIDFVAEKEKSQ